MNKSRKSKRGNTTSSSHTEWNALEVVHPHAAGIDVGGHEHWVAIAPDRDAKPVRRFGTFTPDLREMARWLMERGITSVAMQSTGVYWMPVFEILQEHGLEVFLVNAQHTKNVPGRKTDIQECQWLLKLHALGLLRNSFQPTDKIRTARAIWRHRNDQVAEAASCVQRIGKVLVEMNVQLGNVLSDLSGVSAMTILQKILDGERDAQKLAGLVQPEVKASREEIAKSLDGNWRPELLEMLKDHLDTYRFYQKKIGESDKRLRKHLSALGSRVHVKEQPLGRKPKGKRGSKNAPSFDLRTELYRITGIDWTQINGIDVLTAQTVMSETSVELGEFPTEKHFTSWLGLAPTNDTSGGKILNRRTRKVVNRATMAFRMAASTLLRSQSYLGAQYRRLRTRLGAPKAISAMARKLAVLYYRLIKNGQQYVDQGVEFDEARNRAQELRRLAKKAQTLGVQLVIPATA